MGILANSVAVSHTSSSADDTKTGYVTNQRVALSLSLVSTSFAWSISPPSGSSLARSALSSTTDAGPTFVPDVPGLYLVSCLASDGTTYLLRLTVNALAILSPTEAIWLSPIADASVPTPALGAILYYSTDQSAPAVKLSDGTVNIVDLTPV